MNNRYKQILVSALLTLGVVACSSGGGTGGGVSDNGGGNNFVDERVPGVFISQSSVMPVNGKSGQTFYVVAHNDTDQAVTLKNIAALNYSNKSQAKIEGLKTNLYNAAACSNSLAANQSCLIAITPEGNSGGFVLQADFISSGGKAYNVRQALNYGEVPTNGGFSVNGDNLRVVKPVGQNYYIAVPFVLNQNYSAIDVTSQITPISKKILCNAEGYAKGNSCTAILEYAGGNYSGKISFNGTPKLQKVRQAGLLATSTASSVNFSATTELIPNLIHNGYNALVRPASVSSKTVSIVNTGLAAATLGNITPASSSVSVSSGGAEGCTNGLSLAAGASCSFDLTTTTATHTSSSVTINYDSSKTATFNVNEIANAAVPGISLTSSGSLDYTVINQANNVTIQVKNDSTSATTLENLNFTGMTDSQFVLDNVDCPATLVKGATCNLNLRYTPTAAGAAADLALSASASYKESDGTTGSVVASKIDIHYSSVAALAALTISPSAPAAMQIRADGVASATQVFTISNNGDTTATALRIDRGDLPQDALLTSDSCSNTTLDKAGTCQVTVNFGPTRNALASMHGHFIVSYKNSARGDATPQSQNSQEIDFLASLAALITTTQESAVVIGTPNADVTDLGDNNYSMVPTAGHYATLSYTYTNTGTADATNFNVLVNYPGVDVVVEAGSCPTGNTASVLAAGDSCTLKLQYVNNDYFQAFGYTAPIMFNRPGFSYVDNSQGQATLVTAAIGTVATTVSLHKWADIVNTVSTPDAANHTFDLTFTLNALSSIAATAPVTINLPKLAQEGFTPVSSSSCQLNDTLPSTCTISLSYQAYTPSGNYYVEYSATPDGGAAVSSPLSGKIAVTLP